MRAVIAKCGRYRPVGIEYRDYMAYTGLTVRRQFFNAANGDLKRNGRFREFLQNILAFR